MPPIATPASSQALRMQINNASYLDEKDRLMLHALALIAAKLELIAAKPSSGSR